MTGVQSSALPWTYSGEGLLRPHKALDQPKDLDFMSLCPSGISMALAFNEVKKREDELMFSEPAREQFQRGRGHLAIARMDRLTLTCLSQCRVSAKLRVAGIENQSRIGKSFSRIGISIQVVSSILSCRLGFQLRLSHEKINHSSLNRPRRER